jgi:hypothetical protein
MSCLFDSLSYFINADSYSIRQKICDYLQANKPILDGLDTNIILSLDGPDYISRMRNSSEWGGAIEIQSACNLWSLRVIVHTLVGERKQIEFVPINGDYKYTIQITWNGVHYSPIMNTLEINK